MRRRQQLQLHAPAALAVVSNERLGHDDDRPVLSWQHHADVVMQMLIKVSPESNRRPYVKGSCDYIYRS